MCSVQCHVLFVYVFCCCYSQISPCGTIKGLFHSICLTQILQVNFYDGILKHIKVHRLMCSYLLWRKWEFTKRCTPCLCCTLHVWVLQKWWSGEVTGASKDGDRWWRCKRGQKKRQEQQVKMENKWLVIIFKAVKIVNQLQQVKIS